MKRTINKERKKYNQLINQFNLETNEQKREKLMEKIGEFG